MKDNLAIGVITLTVLLGTAGVVAVVHGPNSQPRPIDATWRSLDSDPEFYDGALVRLPAAGSQPGDAPGELVYRRRADSPPVVVCVFTHPPNGASHFCGRVTGRRGSAVLVAECRPCQR